jgi:hypothetical protein
LLEPGHQPMRTLEREARGVLVERRETDRKLTRPKANQASLPVFK